MDEEPIIYSITTLNQDFQQRHTPKNIKHKLNPNELPLTKKKLKHQKPCKRQHKNIAEDVNDEENWIWFRCSCYYFSKEELTWRESQSACSSLNSSLIKINKEEM
ncbi:hypothetical protein Celaphus_00013997, partial [Cervus elaphus hippelaphus]